MIVHHESGARLFIDELVVSSSFAATPAGAPPRAAHFDEAARRLLKAFGPRALERFASAAWPASDEAMRRRARELPHLVCAADVRFDRGAPEGEERAAFAWFDGRALAKDAEAVVQACATISLDAEPQPRPIEWNNVEMFTSADREGVHLRELRLRFLPGDAWLPPDHVVLPGAAYVEAPVFVRALLAGGRISPDAAASSLAVGFVAEGVAGQTLSALVDAHVSRIAWRTMAVPDHDERNGG